MRYAQTGSATAPLPLAGPEVRLTLPEAVYLGLRQNLGVRGAYLQRVLDKYNLHVAESAFAPKASVVVSLGADRTGTSLNGSAELTPTVQLLTPLGTIINFGWDMRQDGRRQPGGGQLKGRSALTFSLIQPLLKGAGYDANMASIRTARLQEHYNQLRLKSIVASTVTDIARAYHQFVQTRQQIVLAEGALSRARDLEATNQALIASGRMANIELVQAQSTVAAQELALLQAENAFEAARLGLLALLALDLNTRVVPADSLSAEPVRVELDTVRALAFENRPDYLSQLIAIEGARIGLDVARNQRLWDLSANVGLNVPGSDRTGWRATRSLPDTKTDLRTGLQLSIPINDKALKQQEVQATIGLRQGEVLLDQMRAQIDQQVRNAVRSVDAAWRQYKLSHRVREFSEKSSAGEMLKLRSGRSSNFQVVSFQDQLRSAENAELAALVVYLDSLLMLDLELGMTLDTWGIQLNDGAP
ncbi:TolC family protein [Azospirillum argentinense]|uniref:TolC family protein n=1 Tax=Azospirillum argentinense TaxID=2970906 RepID=UPI0032DEF143